MNISDKLPRMAAASAPSISDGDRKTMIFGSWLVGAIILVFTNRFILIDLDFAAPMALAAWQTFMIVVVTQAFALQKKLSDVPQPPGNVVTWDMYATYLAPIGALMGVIPLWSTIASRTLPLWQIAILQGLTPMVAAGLTCLLGARVSLSKFLSIAGILCALLIATVGGTKFGKYDTQLTDKQLYGAGWTGNERITALNSTAGLSSEDVAGLVNGTELLAGKRAAMVNHSLALLCGLFAVFAQATSKVLMEILLKARKEPMSPSQLLLKISPITFFVVSVASFYVESADMPYFFSLPTGVLLGNALAAVIVAYSIPTVIQMSSATTYLMADSLRQTFVTFLACVVYNIPIGVLHAVSFFIGFAGFAKYAEKEVPKDADIKASDYAMVSNTANEDADDTEANVIEPSHYEKEKIAEATGSSVNMFIVLCALLLSVLVVASSTTRPTLSPAQAVKFAKAAVPYEKSKVATIIETRNLPHLGPLLLQFITVLPPDWPVLAWCSPENIEVLRQIPAIARNVEDGRLELRLFPHQFDIHDQEYLSRFLTKPWFWETMEQEWILFFQSDSILCSKSPQKIDDWLGFDWVGAPWEDSVNAKGGNGGLSIRKRSSMIKLTTNPDIARQDYGDPEDVWFSRKLVDLPGVRWPTEHQAKFSVENLFGAMHEWSWRPLGVHSGGTPPGTWRAEDVMNRLMDWCPELKLFYDPRKYIGT